MHTHRNKGNLDNEYRNKWMEFYLTNGTIEDSRKKYWRHVEWEKVVKIEVHIRNIIHTISVQGKPDFLFFLNFRKQSVGKDTRRLWVVGWTNGSVCDLLEIDFHSGNLFRRSTEPLSQHHAHIHPRVMHLVGLKNTVLT